VRVSLNIIGASQSNVPWGAFVPSPALQRSGRELRGERPAGWASNCRQPQRRVMVSVACVGSAQAQVVLRAVNSYRFVRGSISVYHSWSPTSDFAQTAAQ